MDSSSAVESEGSDEQVVESALLRVVAGVESKALPTWSTWSTWLAVAQKQRVVPLLYQLVDRSLIDLSDEQRLELTEALAGAMELAAVHDANLIQVSGLLRSSGITVVALKGAATANLDYPDPSWRQYGDLDVLVDPHDLPATCRILADEGWRQGYPLPAGHEAFVHAVTMVRGRSWEVDVHQRIAHRAVGLRVPTADLLRRAVPFTIAGAEVWALSPTDRLIHAAVHEGMSRSQARRLSSAADVMCLAARHESLAGEVIERSDSWGIRSLVEGSIRRTYRRAELELPNPWIDAMRPSRRRDDRLIQWAYADARRRPVLEEAAHLRLMETWSERFTYLKALLFVDEDYARMTSRRGLVAQARYLAERARHH